MIKGILSAEVEGQKQEKTITAVDSMDLTASSIGYIMDRAKESSLWAKGHIILKDSEGNILREMPAKGDLI